MKLSNRARALLSVGIVGTFFLVGILLLLSRDEKELRLYEGLDYYVLSNYSKLSDVSIYNSICERSYNYFPNYSDFLYKENLNNFYIYDGLHTISSYRVSFTLELMFGDKNSFDNYLKYERERINYTDAFDISYTSFNACITTSESITYYRYKQSIPYTFGLLAFDENKMIVRMIYYRDSNEPSRNFTEVFKGTNCIW